MRTLARTVNDVAPPISAIDKYCKREIGLTCLLKSVSNILSIESEISFSFFFLLKHKVILYNFMTRLCEYKQNLGIVRTAFLPS